MTENPGQKEIELIASSALQAKAIINDLIEAIRIDTGTLVTQKTDLNLFFGAILGKWRTNTNRLFSADFTPSLYANINPSKLERVIDNLISNAIKFSPADQPIDLSLSKTIDGIQIKIADHGIGIPEELKGLIFEQFTSAGRKGLQGEKSMGLGLHISKRIIEQHLGRIFVESEENRGTKFNILLPSC